MTQQTRKLYGLAIGLALLVGLGACTREQVGASLQSWCRNTPDHCSVSAAGD